VELGCGLYRKHIELSGEFSASYAMCLESQGRVDEALKLWEERLPDSDADGPSWMYSLHYFVRRDYERALAVALEVSSRGKTNLHGTWLARCYEQAGRHQEALETIRSVRRTGEWQPTMLAVEGHILASMGRTAEARQQLTDLETTARYHYVPPVFFAILAAGLGDTDAAFEWLDRAYGLAVDPYWDPLRGDPRYTELLRRVGLLDRLQPLSTTATPAEEP
jgi:tetratricopeptide (TPR) repeat protein